MSIKDLKIQARGRWPDILARLGVPQRMLNKRNQCCPQPGCGGKDRWRWTNHQDNGQAVCTHCGTMSPLDVLMAVRGWDLMTAVKEVEGVLGISRYRPERTMDRDKRSAMLNDLWRKSREITPQDSAGLYLGFRCGLISFPACLRFIPEMTYKGDREAGIPDTAHPGLVALVTGSDGTNQTIHRTYLTLDGHKAKLPSPRRLMPGGFEPGSAVRLTPPAPVMGVAEGIETALSATLLTGLPCWALIDAHNLSRFRPPEGTTKVVVFGDNDPGFVGQAAAYALAKALTVKRIEAEVRIPDGVGVDWNDVWTTSNRGMAA